MGLTWPGGTLGGGVLAIDWEKKKTLRWEN